MSKETLEELSQRAHSGQWDFDQLLSWYYDETRENDHLRTLLSAAVERGFLRHAADCPMDAFYGKEKCTCGFPDFADELAPYCQIIRDRKKQREEVIAALNNMFANKMDRIGRFTDEYEFLSNFFEREFEFDGYAFKTVEHAFQANKAMDGVEFDKIAHADTPGQAKRLGRKCLMKQNWESVKIDYMYRMVLAKFEQHADLAKRLIATYPRELMEGNTWNDTFWGVCNGVGENHLGKILMRVRDEIMKGAK